jgi:murein DD-endopeptidase MepM/ murein hydrolase activator NlpD
VALCILVLVTVVLPGVAAADALVYAPPVEAPVVDAFRLPDGPYGAGNRGLEYATDVGATVRAVADGTVAFAGPVAGRLVVSVEHPDGNRSSLTGLATIATARGAEVRRGDVLGTAGERLHLGVRRDQTYLDPAALFATSDVARVHLVPADGPLDALFDAEVVPVWDGSARNLSAVTCPPACKPPSLHSTAGDLDP